MKTALKAPRKTAAKKKNVRTGQGPILRQRRESFGISRSDFARVVNLSERSLATHEKSAAVPPSVTRRIEEALRLLEALKEIIGKAETVTAWLTTKNRAFDNSTPLQVIEKGESDRLWQMVYEFRTGAFA